MASEVTGASLTDIYDRLKDMPRHHPLNAETFSDWSMEAGDTIKVTRDGKEYTSPVHSSTMVWKGKTPQITVNSTGNEKRDALTKVSRQKFGRGGGAIRTAGRQFHFEANQEKLMYEVFDEKGNLSRLTVDMGKMQHEVYDEGGKVSVLRNDLDGLHHDMYDPDGTVSELKNDTKGFKTRLAKVVDEKTGKIKVVEIATEINRNGSLAYINADHIKLNGETFLNGVLSVSNGAALLSNGATVSGGPLRLLSSSSLQINGSSSGTSVSLGYNDFVTMIVKAQVDGNVLKLWQRGNNSSTPSLTFSKATTLSGEWSGGRYTVVAKQNDIEVDTNTTRIVALTSNGEVTKVGKNVNRSYKVQYTQDNIHLYDTGFSAVISMNAESVYNDGYSDGYSQGQASYISKLLRCTSVEQEYPGSLNNIYTFTIEGNYNFHENLNYTFFRTVW